MVKQSIFMHFLLEHFIVWMHAAGLPHFRKRWGRILQDLPAGKYLMNIKNSKWALRDSFLDYDVSKFSGKKYFILSTTNAFGGNNIVLGGFFIAVAGISVFLCLFFYIAYMIKQSKDSEVQSISNQQ